MLAARGMQRWGSGGARLIGVQVGEPSSNGAGVELHVTFEAEDLEEGVICVGFLDETGYEVAAVESPALRFARGPGSVTCRVAPLPLRPGLYFPTVGILSHDGIVRDRWQLDRPMSILGGPSLASDFGVVALSSDWTEASFDGNPS